MATAATGVVVVVVQAVRGLMDPVVQFLRAAVSRCLARRLPDEEVSNGVATRHHRMAAVVVHVVNRWGAHADTT